MLSSGTILFFNLSSQTMVGGVSEIAVALTSESNKGWAKGIGTAAKFAGPAVAIASIYLQEDVPSAQELHEEVRQFILFSTHSPRGTVIIYHYHLIDNGGVCQTK